MGVAKFAHHIVVVLHNWILLYYIGLLTVYMQPNEGINIVSHLLPVSVWSIVLREVILLPAELIPLSEENIDHAFKVQGGSLNLAFLGTKFTKANRSLITSCMRFFFISLTHQTLH